MRNLHVLFLSKRFAVIYQRFAKTNSHNYNANHSCMCVFVRRTFDCFYSFRFFFQFQFSRALNSVERGKSPVEGRRREIWEILFIYVHLWFCGERNKNMHFGEIPAHECFLQFNASNNYMEICVPLNFPGRAIERKLNDLSA